ncbi:hypothetical protein AN958_07232 [Leucoagaricus sp. SymC.cos]|nr:hypothetical protein AN958_07232 [Leucoagaricus sp. SymC.cos]
MMLRRSILLKESDGAKVGEDLHLEVDEEVPEGSNTGMDASDKPHEPSTPPPPPPPPPHLLQRDEIPCLHHSGNHTFFL